jgi:polysaccharide biosynthesis transport protein
VATVNRHIPPTDGTIVPSLLDYLRVVGRRKLLFLSIVLLVPATALAVSLSQDPTYRASAEVLLTNQNLTGSVSGASPYVDPARVAQTQAELARIPAVVNRVLAEVPSAGLDRKEFLESSTVSTTLGSDFLTFSVEASDPPVAMRLATEYAHAFTQYQQQLDTAVIERTLDGVQQQLEELEASGQTATPTYSELQREERELTAAAERPSAQVVQNAAEAPKVGPRTLRNVSIAFLLGLVLALIVVFLADALDTRVKSVDSIREALGLPLLGRLAAPPSRLRKENGLVMLADPASGEAESFRVLRATLDFANAEHGSRTIMITSAVNGEGKSTTAANLAVALARAGRRVVLVDADVGKPHLHRLFSLDERPGLTDLELGDTKLEEALHPISLTEETFELGHSIGRMDRVGSLEVLPGGSALQDPDELGFEDAVGRIIQRLRDRADIVLVDAPPLLMGHAIALSAHVDAVVVVLRLKTLRTSALQDLSRILEASPATKLGFILTGVDRSEGYAPHPRYMDRRAEGAPRLLPNIPPADGGEAVGSEPSNNGQGPSDSAGEREAKGEGRKPAPGAPAGARPNITAPSFGGLSPSEAGKRSAEKRKANAAERAEAQERAPLDATQDAAEDA